MSHILYSRVTVLSVATARRVATVLPVATVAEVGEAEEAGVEEGVEGEAQRHNRKYQRVLA
jgi:hypothetical protein